MFFWSLGGIFLYRLDYEERTKQMEQILIFHVAADLVILLDTQY